jgi:hypothetical protein
LILYVLGNLVSYGPVKNSRLGCLAKLGIQKGFAGDREVTLISGVVPAFEVRLEEEIPDYSRFVRVADQGQ